MEVGANGSFPVIYQAVYEKLPQSAPKSGFPPTGIHQVVYE